MLMTKTHKNISTGKARKINLDCPIKSFKIFLKTIKSFKNIKIRCFKCAYWKYKY